VFRNHELTLDAAMASACLPTLHAAVTIDGEPYWDGGFSANPPLMPLLRDHSSEDLLVVMLSPMRLGDTPRSVEDIRERSIDIGFNAGYLTEMRLIAEARAMSNRAWWHGPFERRLRRTRWHLIDDNDHLAALPSDSKLISNSPLLERLRDAGRQRMLEWLQAHGPMIGRRSTVDLERVFGGHEVAVS
jgi:NTE family protein